MIISVSTLGICSSIVANAYVFPLFLIHYHSSKSFSIIAGGIFIFPILSPTLALHLKFTQPQLTTIVLLWGLLPDLPPFC
jgi:hypothetical protein